MVVEDRFAPVFAGNPDVDQILAPNAGSLARFRPHLALNLHGGATSVRLMLAAASGLRAGFGHFRFQPMYNVRIPRAQEILGVDRTVHTAEHLASAMFYLGVPQSEIPRARLFAAPHLPAASLRRPASVCVGGRERPGRGKTSSPLRNIWMTIWGSNRCSSAGASEDLSAFGAHTCFQGAPLEEVKSLLAGAALFVGNDSGPAHIAAAFGRPVVVLVRIVGHRQLASLAHRKRQCLTSPQGIHSIEVSEVTGAIETLAPLPAAQPSA